ncbi:hypothetical protein CK203_038887 [Vitis vinifera]|uniref:Uncharacterized protein n=1 Tax=Vitis vinifera TaxID=29760 RepID=A0A438HG22_VITVI|nr:hypothetical protein CK203_038887 [Vitis vinifera]
MLRPRVPGDPRSCQMDGRTISTNIDSWFSRSCKRRPDRVSGHTLRWFCQPWLERIISWLFTRWWQAIITLRRLTESWEAPQLSEIVGSDLPSFLSFHSAAQGYVAPLMRLAHRISDHGIKVTFVNSDFIHAKLLAALHMRLRLRVG